VIYLVLAVGIIAFAVACVSRSQNKRDAALGAALAALLIALIFGGQW
jgi:hypothetical protein